MQRSTIRRDVYCLWIMSRLNYVPASSQTGHERILQNWMMTECKAIRRLWKKWEFQITISNGNACGCEKVNRSFSTATRDLFRTNLKAYTPMIMLFKSWSPRSSHLSLCNFSNKNEECHSLCKRSLFWKATKAKKIPLESSFIRKVAKTQIIWIWRPEFTSLFGQYYWSSLFWTLHDSPRCILRM